MNENRGRSPKASERQKEELIKYFEDNSQALRIINGSCGDNKAKQRIWIELAHKLNAIDGALKTTSKWAKYWNDIIIYTKTRAKTCITGEFRCDRPPSEIEQRLLILVGHLSLLKKWQQIWDRGNPKEETLKIEQNIQISEFETNHIEQAEVRVRSENSSLNDYDVAEYQTMELEPDDLILKEATSTKERIINDNGKTTNMVFNKSEVLNESLDQSFEEQAGNDATFGDRADDYTNLKNDMFLSELAGNVRSVATSFSTIGAALGNIAMLLEKFNSK